MKGALRKAVFEDAIASFGMLAEDAAANGWDMERSLYQKALQWARYRRSLMEPNGLNAVTRAHQSDTALPHNAAAVAVVA